MIYYTGDIHGSAKGIVAFAQHYELTESDIIVILGDVGATITATGEIGIAKMRLPK